MIQVHRVKALELKREEQTPGREQDVSNGLLELVRRKFASTAREWGESLDFSALTATEQTPRCRKSRLGF
ncbi:hypothetical protein C0J45_16436 [Silurus meridionalis]|nr:hypothetical protein C0J45_16436 [Silurus meridionalis]